MIKLLFFIVEGWKPVTSTDNPPHFGEMELEHTELQSGGAWSPPDCRARHKVAIIVPFRDRETHLRIFLSIMHPMLQRQRLNYRIFVVEQVSFYNLYNIYMQLTEMALNFTDPVATVF